MVGLFQFLLLRALWGPTQAGRGFQKICGKDPGPLTRETQRKVRKFLKTSTSWRVYQDALERHFPNAPCVSDDDIDLGDEGEDRKDEDDEDDDDDGEEEEEEEGAFDVVINLHKYLYDDIKVTVDDVAPSRQTRSMTNTMKPSSYKQAASDASNPCSKDPEDITKDVTKNMAQLELGAMAADAAGDIIEQVIFRKSSRPTETPLISPKSPLRYDPGVRETKRLEDEILAVFGLVNFLHALTMRCKQAKGRWLPIHYNFNLQIRGTQKSYTTRVDGIWRISDSNKIGIIAEAKREIRHKEGHLSSVLHQEASEMAAWIWETHKDTQSSSSGKEYKKLLVSINQNEIYLNTGTYTSKYVDYLRGDPDPEDFKLEKEHFLYMQAYGPFVIFNKASMVALAKMILGFSIQNGEFHGRQ